MRTNQNLLLILLALLVFISGCSSSAKPSPVQADAVVQITATTESAATPSNPKPTPTEEIIFTPTPDTRIPPEQWQSWPIIPTATNRAKEIYQQGLAAGVNPYAFSKIGDCQNVKESFMGIYDTDRYFLQDWQNTWQETIDQFTGYFDRDSLAFGQGLNVAAALSPLHADPKYL